MSFKKPEEIKELLIDPYCIEELLNLNFNSHNTLLTGRAGVGKTLICKILKNKYKHLNYYENISNNFTPAFPSIATSNNTKITNKNFDKIIEIVPLSKIVLLKKLINVLDNGIFNKQKTLYTCINKFYPNINKIISEYTYENSILF